MNFADFIVIAVLVICVFLAIRYMKKHKSSCNGDCANCGSSCGKKE